MFSWFQKKVAGSLSSRSGRKPGARRVQPLLETLEERLVPTVTVNTDYTQYAQSFARHSGPTNLYLNFDGWKDKGVAAFTSTTGDRDRDIQDILYRTSEIFAPFDVRVLRFSGDGAHATDYNESTIFIGDTTDNGSGSQNVSHAYTPADNSDFPGSVKGYFHRPNGDDADVAYVDPMAWSAKAGAVVNVENNQQIAQAAAHEAGHTFGLGHVRTDVDASGNFVHDPAGLGAGTLSDIMSYTDSNKFFADRSLPLTDFNYDGHTTSETPSVAPQGAVRVATGFGYIDVPFRYQTQNSYAYLTAVLGSRPGDDFANVVHSGSVQYYTAAAPIGSLATVNGTLERGGDYDAFTLNAIGAGTATVQLSAAPSGSRGFNPALFVYSGSDLVAFSDAPNPSVSFAVTPGKQFSIVAGGLLSWDGAYQLSVHAPVPVITGVINRIDLTMVSQLNASPPPTTVPPPIVVATTPVVTQSAPSALNANAPAAGQAPTSTSSVKPVKGAVKTALDPRLVDLVMAAQQVPAASEWLAL